MRIYLCGDSTAASFPERQAPFTGWGQMLPAHLPGCQVINRAMAGRSTKSFLADGRLQAIERELQPGDLLLIQFTHNDTSDLVWRHTDAWSSFRNNLSIFVDTARTHGAIPVLLTPICRRYWSDGRLQQTHGDYPQAIRTLAQQKGVALIDLYALSFAAVSEMGEEASSELYLRAEPGQYPAYPDGYRDDTHTMRAGADLFAGLAAGELKRLGLV